MRSITLCFAIALAALINLPAFAQQNTEESSRSLQMAIEEFNMKAAEHPVGKTQPLLTEDEVISAIRGWIPDIQPVKENVYEQYQSIAESREMPVGSKLRFLDSWGHRGFRIEGWFIDLQIETAGGAGYGFRIRDQKLSSRRMTPAEIQRAQEITEIVKEASLADPQTAAVEGGNPNYVPFTPRTPDRRTKD